MSLDTLAAISRRYGSNPDYVLAGGGNTSFKDESTLYIKASGFPLSTIGPDGFAAMDRAKLAQIWRTSYPEDRTNREARALEDLMNARCNGETKRPSVETLLHETLDDAYVVHIHPALVNGLTCSVGGEKRARELFGDALLWIPVVDPGYLLARTVRRRRSAHIATHGRAPEFILLENHGIFVSRDAPEAIDECYADVFNRLKAVSPPAPERGTPRAPESDTEGSVVEAIRRVLGKTAEVACAVNDDTLEVLTDAASFAPVSSAYTPDHIVYAGHMPCYVTDTSEKGVEQAIEENRSASGRDPKIVAVRGVGVFGVGASEKAAETAIVLFSDAMQIARFATAHGGPQFLPQPMIEFILDWEVEQYRSTIGT